MQHALLRLLLAVNSANDSPPSTKACPQQARNPVHNRHLLQPQAMACRWTINASASTPHYLWSSPWLRPQHHMLPACLPRPPAVAS
jgi:hypothetical protein